MVENFQDKGLQPKETRVFTPEERYIRKYTPTGRVLGILEGNHDIVLTIAKLRGPGARAIKSLEKHEILEIKEGQIENIRYENLNKLWEESNGAKILKLFKEQNNLTVRQISQIVKKSFNNTNDEIHKLEKSGLLESRQKFKERVFYLPVNSERKL